MELLQNTIFINLESRKDRLKNVQEELTKIGVVGERFNDIQTKNGAVGCSMSHIKCLEMAKERGYEQVFICEDDISFTNPSLFLENIQKFYENEDEILWDVLITGGNVCPPHIVVTDYCSRVLNCQTTLGYIVKKEYYDTLLLNFKQGLTNLIRNPANHREFAIDIYWKKLQMQDYWYIITPLTVSQRPDYSDVEKRNVDYNRLMLDIEKTWLRPVPR